MRVTEDRSLGFPRAEFQGRINALQDAMEQARLDALLLTAPADVFYTTGFLTRFWASPAREWFVAVPVEGAPVAVIPEIGAALMQRTWIDDIRTWPAPDGTLHGITLLARALAEIVPEQGRIGLPMGQETHLRMPLARYTHLVEALAPRAFVDATAVLQRVREIKSDAEIDAVRRICAIADRAFEHVPDLVRSDPALASVFRKFQGALLAEGADWVSYLAGGVGQGGYSDVISPADDRHLSAGDVLMLDTGAVRAGYFCDFNRNFAIGDVAPETAKVQDALWQATEQALEMIRPGLKASDIHKRMFDALREAQVEPGAGRMGHGLGIVLTEWPSLAAHDDSLLREGMVLTLEPSAMLSSGRMLVHEENLVLRREGAELLSKRAPREMPVITL